MDPYEIMMQIVQETPQDILRQLEQRAVDNFRRELELGNAYCLYTPKIREFSDPPGGCAKYSLPAAIEDLPKMGFFDRRQFIGIAAEDFEPGDDIEIWPDGTIHKAVRPPPPILQDQRPRFELKDDPERKILTGCYTMRLPRLNPSLFCPTRELIREFLREQRALPKNPSRRQRKIKKLMKLF